MHNDLMGNPIEPGDTVAWAAVAGRSAYIRVGIVTKINDNGGFYAQVTEKGSLSWRDAPDKPVRVTYSDRTLIVRKADFE